MRGQDIIDRARPILQDDAGVRWQDSDLLNSVADAQQLIAKHLPESVSITTNLALDAGKTKQSIGANYVRLLRITRNMGEGGANPGAAISPTTREALDAVRMNWNTEQGREVQHFIYDPLTEPKTFYVYPAPRKTLFVEAVLEAVVPTAIASSTTLKVADSWINEVLDWVLYRAFSTDADHGGNLQRALSHGRAFADAIGMEFQTRPAGNINQEVRPNRG